MASKRHLRRKSCEGKIQFPDKETAMKACFSYKRKFGQFMTAYPCKFGNHWHMGHPTKQVRTALSHKYG